MGTVYDRVKDELERSRRTWVWLGQQLGGVEKAAMTNWKTRGIPAKYHHPIADALGVRWEWLLGIDKQKHATEGAPPAEETLTVGDTVWDTAMALKALPQERQRQYRDMVLAEVAVWTPQLQAVLAKHGVTSNTNHTRGNSIPAAPRGGTPAKVITKVKGKA